MAADTDEIEELRLTVLLHRWRNAWKARSTGDAEADARVERASAELSDHLDHLLEKVAEAKTKEPA